MSWRLGDGWTKVDQETKLDVSLDSGDKEVRKEAVANAITVNTHYSDWIRLNRAVAWYLKLKGWIMETCQRRKKMETSANGNSVACNAITRGHQNVTVVLKISLSYQDLRKAVRH